MTKKEIAQYLEENGIDYDVTSLKADLLDIVNSHKEKNKPVEVKQSKDKVVRKYTGIKMQNNLYIVEADGSKFRTLDDAVVYNGSI